MWAFYLLLYSIALRTKIHLPDEFKQNESITVLLPVHNLGWLLDKSGRYSPKSSRVLKCLFHLSTIQISVYMHLILNVSYTIRRTWQNMFSVWNYESSVLLGCGSIMAHKLTRIVSQITKRYQDSSSFSIFTLQRSLYSLTSVNLHSNGHCTKYTTSNLQIAQCLIDKNSFNLTNH